MHSQRPANGFLVLSVVLCGVVTVANSLSAEETPASAIRIARQGSWWTATSSNFKVRSTSSSVDVAEICELCETYRTHLIRCWRPKDGQHQRHWTPQCEVVVHATITEYHRQLSRAAGNSVGCTTVQVKQGQVQVRRIDLRADASDWAIDALPHEMTHVVLTDQFGDQLPPLWADEGMSVLAESTAKRQIRLEASRTDEARRSTISAASLLFDDTLPRTRRDAFYSCSSELVAFLIEQKDAPSFLRFLSDARKRGYDTALKSEYNINGVSHLQSLWRNHHAQHRSQPAALESLRLLGAAQ